MKHQRSTNRTPSLLRNLGMAVRLTYLAGPRSFAVTAAFQVVTALAPTLLVVIGQWLLETLVKDGNVRPSFSQAALPVAALAVVTSLISATTALQQQQQRMLAERAGAEAWEQVLTVSNQVRLETYESPQFFDQLQRIKNNAVTQPLTVTTSIFGLAGSVISVASLLVFVLSIAPILVPILLVSGIPSLLLSRRVSRLEFQFVTRAMPVYRARAYLRDIMTGRSEAKEIRAFRAAPALRRRHSARRIDFESLLAAHTRRRTLYAVATVLMSSFFLVVTLGVVVYLLTSGRIPLSSAAAAILAVRFLATGLEQLFRSVGGLFEASVYLADLADFVRRPRPGYAKGTPAGALERGVDVSDLSFSYPGMNDLALRKVSMHLGAGEIVALVGENGSGKTTLAKIIAGLYRATAGDIRWDGSPYDDLDMPSVHAQIAVIFQDFVRYQLSALDNIGLGEPEEAEDEDAARDAARRARSLDYLERLPDGMHTTLSREYTGGVDLSGGQWQRVALARALRKKASLIILDEPTAALDPRAEAELFGDLRSVLADRSALLISHRFSSVRLADRIYVLREGQVIEHGTHDELVASRGLYAELYALQANAYR